MSENPKLKLPCGYHHEQLAYTMGSSVAGENETDIFLASVILQSYLAGVEYEPEDILKLAKEFKAILRQGIPDSRS